MKYLLYAACALVLIGLAALLPAAAAPPTGGIDLEKYVSVDGGLTWLDADEAPGPTLVSTGPAPQFKFNVTNVGGSALTGVALTDDVLGAITVPGNLVGGASVEVVVTAAWAPGQHTNTATVTATKGGESFSDADAAFYFGVAAVQPPTAAFTGTPTSGVAPLAVTFTDESTGAGITSWSWTFGDGATSTEQSPVHTYTAPGTYTVNLTVTNAGGSDDELRTGYITVAAPPVPPVAAFSGAPTAGDAPLSVTFTDESTGAPTSWAWTFGDGDTSAEKNPSHTYAAPGTYTVNLTVTSADGSDDELKSGYITVTAPLHPSVSIETRTNGDDADLPPGPSIIAGSPVQWSYVVTNTGDVRLTNVAVTDDKGIVVTAPKTVLEPGESMTATASGTAAAGQYANIGTVTGTPPTGQAVTASDPSHYLGVGTPAIDFETYISADGGATWLDADAPPGPDVPAGTDPWFKFVTTNTGDVPLSMVSAYGHLGPIAQLASGESFEAIEVRTWEAGQHLFGSQASGTWNGQTVMDQDGAWYFGASPGIHLEILTNGEDADVPPGPGITVGAPVQWTYMVTNTGNVALSEIAVTDDQGVTVTAPKTSLDPGESMTATASGTAVAGQYANVGTVTANPPSGPVITASDPSHYFGRSPPFAAFSGTPTSGTAPLAVTFTDESTGVPASWSWTFGDGAVSSEQNPGHTYTAPGTYTVNLTVTNADGSDDELRAGYITVAVPPNPSVSIETMTNGEDADTPPGPGITAGAPVLWTYIVTNTGDEPLTNIAITDDQGVVVTAPKTVLQPGESMTATASGTAVAGQYANIGTVTGTPPVGQSVTASDPSHYFGRSLPVAAFTGTPTSGTAPLTVQFTDTSTDNPTAWNWNFGDGSGSGVSTAQNPSHTYTVPGTYSVNLTVTNADGSDDELRTGYITVTAAPVPPVAAFGAVPTSGVAPLTVTFTDESTGAPTAWSWTFGDGATSAAQNPVHTYSAPGTYSVNLTVTNADGSDDELTTGYITVTAAPVPPVAAFTGSPTLGDAPLAVTFTDASTGAPTSWAWDFENDGTVDSNIQNPVHTYDTPGTYSVNLTVTNPDGTDSELRTGYITVNAPPAPGSDRAYFLVSTVPSGAEIYLEDISGTRYLQGNTTSGPLNVTLCLTCTPVRKIVATLPGYLDAVYPIAQYPAKGQTVPVTLTLDRLMTEPFPGPHIPWTIIQAEDYDLGGEGVAYHDVEPANLGGRYRSEGVDIETEAGVTNVGWIRDGEYLKYTIDTTIGGDFYLTLRASNPDAATKPVTVYVDGVPAGQVMIGRTGAWTTFADFTGATPMAIPQGRHVVTLSFEGISRINIDWLRLAAGTVPTVTPAAPAGASFTATPLTAPRGAAVKFTLAPAPGKTVKAAWWSFDAPAHLRTWNSRTINPTFFYPRTGTFSPLVRITYTDNSVEEVHRLNYIRAT